MRRVAFWLTLALLCLPLHAVRGRDGKEIGGIGVAVEAGSINGATIKAANQQDNATARYGNRWKKDS